MAYCAVSTCYNDAKKRPDLSFFRFPKSKPSILKEWVRSCSRKVAPNVKYSRICSEHFLESDYDPSFFTRASLMPNVKPWLKKDAVPTQKLHTSTSSDTKKRAGRTKGDKEAEDTADPDDPSERRRRSIQLRQERQEKKERKELVERLLAEHEEKQAAEQEKQRAAAQQTPVEVIELVTCKAGARKPHRTAAAAGDVVLRNLPTTDAAAADNLSDDDRPPPEDDGAAPDGADSDGEEAAPPPPRDSGQSGPSGAVTGTPSGVPTGTPSGAVTGTPTPRTGSSPVRTPVTVVRTAASATRYRRLGKRPNQMVERTKEILRLKMTVRKLEAKCLRVLSVPGAPRSDTDGGGGEGQEAAEGETQAEGAEGPQAATAGEKPLVVLREERGSKKLPMIVTLLRQNQLSDGMTTFTPSGLQEAQEVNHRLKVQLLDLQATMLKWAIRNKRVRDARQNKLREADERRQKTQKTVTGSRLRELLRLESAVKSMFTESQIRAITLREQGDSTPGGSLPVKRKNAPHWGEEDLRRVLELRAISSDRVLDYVRDEMQIPLPSMQTTRKRCYKSPELGAMYREMLQKSDANQRRCGMCERQVSIIDGVIEAVDDEPAEEEGSGDEPPFGRQFMQREPPPSQEKSAVVRPKKRRRAPAAPAGGKKARAAPAPVPVAPSLNWPDTSDSDAELSDPGVWDRIAQDPLGDPPGDELGGSGRSPLGLYRQRRRAWQ